MKSRVRRPLFVLCALLFPLGISTPLRAQDVKPLPLSPQIYDTEEKQFAQFRERLEDNIRKNAGGDPGANAYRFVVLFNATQTDLLQCQGMRNLYHSLCANYLVGKKEQKGDELAFLPFTADLTASGFPSRLFDEKEIEADYKVVPTSAKGGEGNNIERALLGAFSQNQEANQSVYIVLSYNEVSSPKPGQGVTPEELRDGMKKAQVRLTEMGGLRCNDTGSVLYYRFYLPQTLLPVAKLEPTRDAQLKARLAPPIDSGNPPPPPPENPGAKTPGQNPQPPVKPDDPPTGALIGGVVALLAAGGVVFLLRSLKKEFRVEVRGGMLGGEKTTGSKKIQVQPGKPITLTGKEQPGVNEFKLPGLTSSQRLATLSVKGGKLELKSLDWDVKSTEALFGKTCKAQLIRKADSTTPTLTYDLDLKVIK